MIPPAGAAPPTPAQARELMEKVATLYEGIHIGNAEMRGLSVETPQGPLKLAAMRFNLENGKIGELAFEGLDTRAPKGPVKVGRFALKSLDIANLMRLAAQFANPAQRPAPDQALAAIALLEGAEVKGVVAPYKNTDKQVNVDTLSLDWGQFVGPIPSQAHLVAKLTTPLEAADAPLLVAAGMNTAAIDFDLGAAWTEASHTFVLTPLSLELGNLLKATARVSLGNVPRGVFSINPVQAANMAAQIEAGTIELTLRDLGGVDLAVAQYARTQNVSRDDARRAIIDSIKASTAEAATTNPDVAALADALTHFIETPEGNADPQAHAARQGPGDAGDPGAETDPMTALAQFQVEASTTR